MICRNDKQQVVGKSFLNLFDSLANGITSRCIRPDKSYLLRVKSCWRQVSLVVDKPLMLRKSSLKILITNSAGSVDNKRRCPCGNSRAKYLEKLQETVVFPMLPFALSSVSCQLLLGLQDELAWSWFLHDQCQNNQNLVNTAKPLSLYATAFSLTRVIAGI